jgi:hypothetical protein
VQKKSISIVVVGGSEEVRDMEIAPGVTVAEVLREARLEGYQLSRQGSDRPFESGANLYDLVGDKEKLYATPEDVSVGDFTAAPSGARLLRVYPVTTSLYPPIKRARMLRIRRLDHREDVVMVGRHKEIPYWMRNGWQRRGRTYRGYYRTKHGAYSGLIEEEFANSYAFFMHDPSRELKHHPHWECFSRKGGGKYQIHFSEKPEDISSGIVTIEKLIGEAFENYGNGGGRWIPKLRDLLPFNWRR